jgi:tetratricopeptide (TPR) repeat protein
MGKNIDDEDKVLKKLLGGQSALDHYNARMKEIWDKVGLDKKGIHVNVAKIEVEEKVDQCIEEALSKGNGTSRIEFTSKDKELCSDFVLNIKKSDEKFNIGIEQVVEPYEDDGKPLSEEEVREFMRYLGIAEEKYRIDEAIKYWSKWIKSLKAEGKYGGKVSVGKLKELKEDGYTKIKARGLKEIEVLDRVFGSRDATSEEINCISKREVVQKLHKLLDQDKINEAEEYIKKEIEEVRQEKERCRKAYEGRSLSQIYMLALSSSDCEKIDETDSILGVKGREEVFNLLYDRKLDEALDYIRERVKEDKVVKDVEEKIKKINRIDKSFWEGLLYFVGAGVFAGVSLYLIYQMCRFIYGIIKAIVA